MDRAAQFRQPPKTPENSSVPPSCGQKENRVVGRRRMLGPIELRHVFGRAIRLPYERGQVTPQTFARRCLLIENATDRLVFDRYVAPKTEAARLQQRYRLHRDSLYVFLERDDVEPTNNCSERDQRPSVIHRKVIGSFRSAWGAEASAIRTSILATACKPGWNLFDTFLAIAGPSPLLAIPVRA